VLTGKQFGAGPTAPLAETAEAQSSAGAPARRATAARLRNGRRRPAVDAGAPQHHLVRRDLVAHAPGEAAEHALEPVVLEGIDASAVVADDVVVVLAARPQRLVASDASTNVEPMNESERDELIEDAVNARDSDRSSLGSQSVEDLLCGDTATLLPEELDDRPPRPPGSTARGSDRGQGVLRPVRRRLGHATDDSGSQTC